jgi:hypothetical protein
VKCVGLVPVRRFSKRVVGFGHFPPLETAIMYEQLQTARIKWVAEANINRKSNRQRRDMLQGKSLARYHGHMSR